MNTSSEIWFAFGRTFSMLLLVLALLILGFYLIKRFGTAHGKGSARDLIKVLAVHHLSPKEKLVLVSVLEETILVGVTANNISKLSTINKKIDLDKETNAVEFKFSQFLAEKLNPSLKIKKGRQEEKNEV